MRDNAQDEGVDENGFEELSEAMSNIQISLSKSMGELSSAIGDLTSDSKEIAERSPIRGGDPLEVETRSGSIQHAAFIEIDGRNAEDVSFNAGREEKTIAEYWEDDPEVTPGTKIVTVKLKANPDKPYDFPISKVSPGNLERASGVGQHIAELLRNAGYESYFDLRRASKEELSRIDGIGNAQASRIKADVGDPQSPSRHRSDAKIACSHCDEMFPKDSDEAIEGDQGEAYCSLECLHGAYQ